MEENNNVNNQSSKVMAGLIIVVIGAFLLLDNIGLNIPNWVFNWSNILIIIGLFISAKHGFRNGSGIILIIIGLFFTLKEALDRFYDFDKIGWPALIIVLGLFLIFKPKSNFRKFKNGRRANLNDNFNTSDSFSDDTQKGEGNKSNHVDYLNSVNVFAGSHQVVYSKNFKGGEITAVFGGCDVNLTQADFEGQIVIDVTAVFGGAKLIVPAGWLVKQEVTAIFGGFDDKRTMRAPEGSDKMLIIRGVAMFGGVDIRSY